MIIIITIIILIAVFILGDDRESELVCTTLPVVMTAGAAVVFLQLCLLTTCLLCIHSRRSSSAKPRLARTESVVTSTSGHSLGSQPPGPGLHTLYYDQLTYRSATSILPLPLLTSIFADPWLPPSPTPE